MNKVMLLAWCAAIFTGSAGATEIVYTPVNPSFGGNPLNGSFLLNSAQVQDNYKDPASKDLNTQKSDLEQFNELLQRSILNRIASTVTGQLVDQNGNLVPGNFDAGDFSVAIASTNIAGQLQVTVTDKITGQVTQFTVNN